MRRLPFIRALSHYLAASIDRIATRIARIFQREQCFFPNALKLKKATRLLNGCYWLLNGSHMTSQAMRMNASSMFALQLDARNLAHVSLRFVVLHAALIASLRQIFKFIRARRFFRRL